MFTFGPAALPYLDVMSHRALWAIVLWNALAMSKNAETSAISWQTEMITLPDHVNLDTFEVPLSQLL